MANLNVSDFNKFKAFFKALQDINFDPTKQIPSIVKINGQPTPVDKARCFELLRSFPNLQGKDDNEIIKHLAKPGNVTRILGSELTRAQQIELAQTLTEKPAAEEVVSGQPGGQEATPTDQEVPPPTGSSAGGIPGMGGLPSSPAIPSGPRIIHIVQQTPPPAAIEGGAGQGTAATNKIDRLEAQRVGAATAKENRLTANTPAIQGGIGSGQAATIKPVQPQPLTTDGSPSSTISSSPKFNPSAFRSRISNFAKGIQNFAARANPFLKTNLSRIARGFGGILGGIGGSLAHTGLPGVYNAGARLGTGGMNFMGNSYGRFRNFRTSASRFSSSSSPKGITGKAKSRMALWIILAMLFVTLLGGLIGGLTGTNQTELIPTGTLTGSSDISQCKFTRGGDSVKELTYNSSLLLSYIQEASVLTGIPSAVLAAFIRVETPSTVVKNDEEIRKLSSVAVCPRSETGALGVMQLQPEGTKGNDKTAIANGAKLIGKNYEQVTEEDYCDVRKNIIMGAGFILMKMSYKTEKYPSYGDGTKWDQAWTTNKQAIDKLVNGYYGCLLYPSCSSGPYSYGDDVFLSVQNCQTKTPITPPGPIPTEKLAQIYYWAQIISDNLQQGLPLSIRSATLGWNKMIADILNNGYSAHKRYAKYETGNSPDGIYWCTDIVIDAYNLAGVTGLSMSQESVVEMKSFFANTPGYQLLPPNTPVEQLRAGDVIIFQGDGQHTSIIKSIELSPGGTGKGEIRTFESNNAVKEDIVDVQNHVATVSRTTAKKYVITGFGQIKGE